MPEPLLLVYTKHGCNRRFRTKIRPVPPLDLSELVFKGGFYANAISNKMSCGGSFAKFFKVRGGTSNTIIIARQWDVTGGINQSITVIQKIQF